MTALIVVLVVKGNYIEVVLWNATDWQPFAGYINAMFFDYVDPTFIDPFAVSLPLQLRVTLSTLLVPYSYSYVATSRDNKYVSVTLRTLLMLLFRWCYSIDEAYEKWRVSRVDRSEVASACQAEAAVCVKKKVMKIEVMVMTPAIFAGIMWKYICNTLKSLI